MHRYTTWLLLTCFSAVLAGCGGGSGDASVDTPQAVQQYPGGIWEGTSGTGATQRKVFGYIDPGSTGKGGEFYLAREAGGAVGYDALYGRLSVELATLLASNATYFSVQDGKFASGITWRGTASASRTGGRTDTLSGAYTNPAGTAAATGSTTPIKLSYSALNNHPARLSLIEGTYRGGGVFGGGWTLAITAQGVVSGAIGACAISGTVSTRSADSAAYGVSLNLSGNTTLCANSGTNQAGVAVLKFDDSTGQRTGLWILTRNTTGTPNTYVLEGQADAPNPSTPAATAQSAAGYWSGTTDGTGANAVSTVVLPDGGYFLYRPTGGGHDVLFGNLLTSAGSSPVSSTDGVFFSQDTAQYTSGVRLNGDVRTGASFIGSYTVAASGLPVSFTQVPDSLYPYTSPVTPALARLAGSYTMPPVGFGGVSTTVAVDTQGALTGTDSRGCTLTGLLQPYSGNSSANLFLAQLQYAGTNCPLKGGLAQSGTASARFDAAGTSVVGLRLLTVTPRATDSLQHTVFLGAK